MDSILTSIKKMLGLSASDESFDVDVIIGINTALAALTQIGVGPAEGFTIGDATATWSDFIGTNPKLDFIKSYVYLKVKLIFDPPQSSSVIESYNRSIGELEYRIFVEVDPIESTD